MEFGVCSYVIAGNGCFWGALMGSVVLCCILGIWVVLDLAYRLPFLGLPDFPGWGLIGGFWVWVYFGCGCVVFGLYVEPFRFVGFLICLWFRAVYARLRFSV